MDKKSIVLLIIASIVLILAIVFAVWSFSVDLNIAERKKVVSTNMDINQKTNTTEQEKANKVSEKESETSDFSATYTDFSVEDGEGKQVKLSDYKDHPVMVLFWNNENQDSVEMLNRINEQYENYKDSINFIAIHTGEELTTNLQNIKLPIYYDNEQEISKIYNIVELPTMLYINKENQIFNSKTGLTSVDALTANLDILAENF